ncbi:MAG: 4-hydroxythreonine-4-phosphate dehydrogenase PdxA [Gammaproteobacteria bacterium]|nr:4-hydroxythreonine-4-phosphate dehydrogenase PdxA [Gammaproteobacteria bacterium]
MQKPKIVISSGEPAGIGPDLMALLEPQNFKARIIIVGDKNLLNERALQLGKSISFVNYNADTDQVKDTVEVIHHALKSTVQPGKLNVDNAQYVLDTIKTATLGCINNDFDAMVTAPIQKDIINEANIPFTGHTEYLAQLCNIKRPLMMLATEQLRVALVTTHLPLKDVPAAISEEAISEIAQILHHDLEQKYGITRPHIKVCGLNPHAGENGYLGTEEIDTIIPTINKLQAEMNITGPYPADTVFTQQHLKDADVILAMYHDQGLPVLKHAGFGRAINTTLGLPIIRTSVDHGTALDKAGSNNINVGSLNEAISSAIKQVQCKKSNITQKLAAVS